MASQAPVTKEAEAKPKREKKSNCPACNKVVKRLKRYYRDGKFYCSKKCWRAFISKSKVEEKK
ncbi:MAG: hypothetical protein Q7S42_06290 [Candidatus Omnitrophota bacterium]|nr:hypothetical protein [Candidatus Omnitrophota bacterium]